MAQAQDSLLRDIVTVYAAITGTLGLAVSIWVARRDRADVRVTMDVGISYITMGVSSPPLVFVKAANRWRRAAVLTGCFFRLTNKHVLELTTALTELPFTLGEGASYTGRIPMQKVKDSLRTEVPHGVRLAELVFRTADDREYRMRISGRTHWHKTLGTSGAPLPSST